MKLTMLGLTILAAFHQDSFSARLAKGVESQRSPSEWAEEEWKNHSEEWAGKSLEGRATWPRRLLDEYNGEKKLRPHLTAIFLHLDSVLGGDGTAPLPEFVRDHALESPSAALLESLRRGTFARDPALVSIALRWTETERDAESRGAAVRFLLEAPAPDLRVVKGLLEASRNDDGAIEIFESLPSLVRRASPKLWPTVESGLRLCATDSRRKKEIRTAALKANAHAAVLLPGKESQEALASLEKLCDRKREPLVAFEALAALAETAPDRVRPRVEALLRSSDPAEVEGGLWASLSGRYVDDALWLEIEKQAPKSWKSKKAVPALQALVRGVVELARGTAWQALLESPGRLTYLSAAMAHREIESLGSKGPPISSLPPAETRRKELADRFPSWMREGRTEEDRVFAATAAGLCGWKELFSLARSSIDGPLRNEMLWHLFLYSNDPSLREQAEAELRAKGLRTDSRKPSELVAEYYAGNATLSALMDARDLGARDPFLGVLIECVRLVRERLNEGPSWLR